MKKSKLIALALTGAIIFMGAGYAAWTDNVEIKSTVETGDIDVQFTEDYITSENLYEYLVDHELEASGKNVILSGKNNKLEIVDSGSIKNDGKLLTLSVKNLYPINQKGAIENPGAWYFCPVKNLGSVPVKFDNSLITFKIKDGNNQEISFSTLEELQNKNNSVYSEYENFFKNLECDLTILYSKNSESGENDNWEKKSWALDNFSIMNLNEEITKLFNSNDQIESNGKIGLLFTTHLKKEAPNNTENKTVQIDIQLNWKQFNK